MRTVLLLSAALHRSVAAARHCWAGALQPAGTSAPARDTHHDKLDSAVQCCTNPSYERAIVHRYKSSGHCFSFYRVVCGKVRLMLSLWSIASKEVRAAVRMTFCARRQVPALIISGEPYASLW